jgi:hypothetical protein
MIMDKPFDPETQLFDNDRIEHYYEDDHEQKTPVDHLNMQHRNPPNSAIVIDIHKYQKYKYGFSFSGLYNEFNADTIILYSQELDTFFQLNKDDEMDEIFSYALFSFNKPHHVIENTNIDSLLVFIISGDKVFRNNLYESGGIDDVIDKSIFDELVKMYHNSQMTYASFLILMNQWSSRGYDDWDGGYDLCRILPMWKL